MMIKKSRGLKILMLLAILLAATLIYIFNYLTIGVGNSIEKGTKGIHEFSKSLDSNDVKKVDSLKQDVLKKVDSSITEFN